MRLSRAFPVVLLAILPAALRAEAPKVEAAFADRVPRAWCGVFRWEGETREQHVTIRFNRFVARAGGTIEADGPGLVRYEDEPPDQAVRFRMRAVIDPATRRIEMFERIDVPRSDYVTDGSHVGQLAADLQSMSTVWTTRGTGRRGAMRMNARPEQADLTQGCAPPSSRAPGPPLHNSIVLFAGLTRAAKFAIN
jgi:hypothetical protein